MLLTVLERGYIPCFVWFELLLAIPCESVGFPMGMRTGLPRLTCHQLRHTCLTRLREAGMALEAVQAQAGHRSIESPRIYIHLANSWLVEQYLQASAAIDADRAES